MTMFRDNCFRRFFADMSIPVIISDAGTGEILEANTPARAMLGENITGKKCLRSMRFLQVILKCTTV